MTDDADQLAAQIVAAADKHLDALIQAAREGDKRSKEELHRHIHAEIGRVLDDRLADYVAEHGLPAKGKKADFDSRDTALAFAIAIRMHRGESWQGAIAAAAALANASIKTAEAAFKGDMRKAAEAWAADPGKRDVMLSIAAPYLA